MRCISLVVCVVTATSLGCTPKHTSEVAEGADAAEAEASTVPATEALEDAAAREIERGNPVSIAATNFRVSITDRRAWPESETGARRLGYLRHGATVEAYENRTPNDECTDGWYELVGGGFVCGKAATSDLSSPRVRLAPKQPDRTSAMPYRYGVNLRDGTPLYRRVLNNEDRKKYEPWLIPPKVEEPEPQASAEAAASEGARAEAETTPRAEPAAAASVASASVDEGPARSAVGEEESAASLKKSAELDAGVDASKPKLRELRGRGVLVRKMVRGFSLALDRDFKAAGTRWWRTTFGFAVPYDRVMVQPSKTTYHGTSFATEVRDMTGAAEATASDASAPSDAGVRATASADGGATMSPELALTVGFVTTSGARKLTLGPDEKRFVSSEALPKRSAVLLTGESRKVSGVTYHRTSDGAWVRLGDLLLAKPQAPADLAPDEKWIDVDLTRQALVALEGQRPVFATLVSTGRASRPDEEQDFRTRTGSFRIREKHVTTTMDGDVASDGPYSIEDVPWVMYYDGSYALHGAFWHDRFGHTRSHGCVNLSPEDARTLFRWAEPPVPESWHGVYATEDHPGSRVIVHEDSPPKKR